MFADNEERSLPGLTLGGNWDMEVVDWTMVRGVEGTQRRSRVDNHWVYMTAQTRSFLNKGDVHLQDRRISNKKRTETVLL